MTRKLDVALATELGYELDWEYTRVAGEYGHKSFLAGVWGLYKDGKRIGEIPHYSTDGNAMLELERELHQRGYAVNISFYHLSTRKRFYCVCVYEDDNKIIAKVDADTMPEAVALAAYHALTGKEWTP